MKKILLLFAGLIFTFTSLSAAEKLNIDKQLIGIVGAVSGTVKTKTRELKTGDKIYLNETILASAESGTQILLLDQSTFTIGSESEVVMDTFIYDPTTNDGKIVASVKQGSLKVISGLISKKNPDSLTVEVPEGTLGSRGTEFQTMVSKKQTSTLLIGPGKNNTLGLRPGAVLVGNKLGSTLLSNPYSVSTMQKGKAPGQSKKITKGQLKKFNKKMKALKVAKLEGTKEEKKQIRKEIKKELKAAGLEKDEIKVLIKDNIQKDKEKKKEIKKVRLEKKKAEAKKKKAEAKKKKAEAKKKKAVKKKSTKKKKAVKKKPAKKKKAVKKKSTKKKKAVK
ncbi:MAG: FecR domain-containing protein, partial [Candidatus Pelagibacter sp.]